MIYNVKNKIIDKDEKKSYHRILFDKLFALPTQKKL